MEDTTISTSKQILQTFFKSLVIGIMPFFAFMVITSRTDAIFGIRSFVVLTGSMEPTLPVGSVIFTQNVARYNLGDVISFKSGNVNVTHRIVDIESSGEEILYKTQGDANMTADGPLITADKILGKAFYHVPYIGRISILLKTLPGFLSLVVLPAMLFIFFEIINIKNELTKEIEKKLMQKMQTV